MKYEPVTFEVALVDNGAVSDKLLQIMNTHNVHNVAAFSTNRGIAYGLNTLFFSLCRRSKYVLSMEDDWLWNMTLIKVPVIHQAIEVLRHEQKLLGVAFRQLSLEPADKWTKTPSGVEYAVIGTNFMNVYVNGGMIHNRQRLLEIGPHRPEKLTVDSEFDYKTRVWQSGLRNSMLRTWPICFDKACDNHSVVFHIGDGRHVDNVP